MIYQEITQVNHKVPVLIFPQLSEKTLSYLHFSDSNFFNKPYLKFSSICTEKPRLNNFTQNLFIIAAENVLWIFCVILPYFAMQMGGKRQSPRLKGQQRKEVSLSLLLSYSYTLDLHMLSLCTVRVSRVNCGARK